MSCKHHRDFRRRPILRLDSRIVLQFLNLFHDTQSLFRIYPVKDMHYGLEASL